MFDQICDSGLLFNHFAFFGSNGRQLVFGRIIIRGASVGAGATAAAAGATAAGHTADIRIRAGETGCVTRLCPDLSPNLLRNNTIITSHGVYTCI